MSGYINRYLFVTYYTKCSSDYAMISKISYKFLYDLNIRLHARTLLKIHKNTLWHTHKHIHKSNDTCKYSKTVPLPSSFLSITNF